jgi:hypothetical protein
LQETLWAALLNDLTGDLLNEGFPIWRRDVCGVCDRLAVVLLVRPKVQWDGRVDVLLCMHRLKHQQRLPQIPPAVPRDPLVQALHLLPPLLLAHRLEHAANLRLCRRRNPHQQCPTPDRRNDVARRVCQQNQPQIGTVLLHRPPQRRLRIARQVVCLIDDDDLEALFCAEVDLLCLRDFLEQILHNYSVVVSDIGGRDLEVVYRSDDVEFEFAVCRGLEDARVDLDLLDTGAIQLLECCDDARLLACAGRTVYKEMWKVTALCLRDRMLAGLALKVVLGLTRARNLSESSGW